MAGAIHSTLNGISPIDGYRQDASEADAVALSLVNLDFVPASYNWQMIGRPYNSVAGGAGPLPVSLGTAATASFTVDSDVGDVSLDGMYLVRCTLNGNSPSQQILEVGICRPAPGVTLPGLSGEIILRKLGVFEGVAIDTFDGPNYLAGWAKQLNFWLELIRQIAVSGAPPALINVCTRTNSEAFTIHAGQIVRPSSNSHVLLAHADTGDTPDPGLTGIVFSASIASGAPGQVQTNGVAPVQFIGGLTLAAGDSVWTALTTGGFSGRATNKAPIGEWIEPIGTIEDASAYSGTAGQLALVNLRIPPAPFQMSRRIPVRLSNIGAGTYDVLTIPTPVNYQFHVEARVLVGKGTSNLTAARTISALLKNVSGLSIVGSTNSAPLDVDEIGSVVASLVTSGNNLILRVVIPGSGGNYAIAGWVDIGGIQLPGGS